MRVESDHRVNRRRVAQSGSEGAAPLGLVFGHARVHLESDEDDTKVVVLNERSGVLTRGPRGLTVQPIAFRREIP